MSFIVRFVHSKYSKMITKTFPISSNIPQIPLEELKRFFSPSVKCEVLDDKIEIMKDDDAYDLDFRELQAEEITPQMQKSLIRTRQLSREDLIRVFI